MCFYYFEKKEVKLNCFETFTLYPAVMLNFGWVTIASTLSVSVALLKFEMEFPGDDVLWAVASLAIVYSLFFLSALIYNTFLYGMVFVYYSFCLFLRYIFVVMDSGNL